VKGEFIGGADIMGEMHESGELAKLFQEAGIVS
jgi:monothiol glutaredoxin